MAPADTKIMISVHCGLEGNISQKTAGNWCSATTEAVVDVKGQVGQQLVSMVSVLTVTSGDLHNKPQLHKSFQQDIASEEEF